MGTNEKIKVCHLISGDLWAGAEVQAYVILSSLSRLPQLDLTVVILNEGKLAKELRKIGLNAVVIDESVHGFFPILRLIKENLKDKNIDILHSHRYKENVLGGLLKKSGTVRHLVQTVHGIDEPFKGIKRLKINLYSKLNEYFTRNYFNKVLTVSFDIQNKLSKIITPEKLITIHNAINTANLKVTRSAVEVREELGIGKNHPIIGSVGRMVPIKGYDIFLKAAKVILEVKPEVTFLLAGDGPLKSEFERTAKEMGLEKAVKFLGFREDILDIINCFDIFMLSSYYEGIPIALLEAMALKKAVVATMVGGLKEVIEENVSGLLVEPGDPQALALACAKLLGSPELRCKMEIAAKERIDEEFSIDVQRGRVLKIYSEIMSQA
jgi:glycosyltransferase involved in cell wall biosynthesis